MDTDEQNIRAAFALAFEPWRIHLPDEPLTEGARGEIRERGWCIVYRVCVREERLCLQFFASHRMTNDRMEQIDAEGNKTLLGSFRQLYRDDDDLQMMYRENEDFYARVRAAGLHPHG